MIAIASSRRLWVVVRNIAMYLEHVFPSITATPRRMAPVTMSCTAGEAPRPFRPERNTAGDKTPAAIPSGRPTPPERDTPPRMAAAVAGTSTSDSPEGDAEA